MSSCILQNAVLTPSYNHSRTFNQFLPTRPNVASAHCALQTYPMPPRAKAKGKGKAAAARRPASADPLSRAIERMVLPLPRSEYPEGDEEEWDATGLRLQESSKAPSGFLGVYPK